MEWSDGASEGTDVKSTGESGTTKFLRVDGDGTCSWQVPPDTNTQVGGSTGVDFNDDVKARFGTGNDLQIWHSGTDGNINNDTGDLYVQSDDQLILKSVGTTEIRKHAGDELMIKTVPDGAVELYYDNSKKLETTSSGINVTGQINVNGSALSAAPEVELVADGSISANEAVIVTGAGKAKSITGFSDALVNVSGAISDETISNDDRTFQIAEDRNTGRLVYIWKSTGSSHNNRSRFRVGTRTGTSVTWGTEYNLSDSNITADDMQVVGFDTDKFFVFYRDGGDSHYYARIISTTSSNTASLGTKVIAADQSNNNRSYCYSPQLGCKGDGTGGVLIGYGTNSGNPSGHLVGRYATISGTTITMGAEVSANSNTPEFLTSTWDESRNTLWISWRYSNNHPQSTPLKQPSSGTTVLIGDTYNIYEGNGSLNNSLAYDPDHQVFWWFYKTGNRIKYKTGEFNSSSASGNGQIYPTNSGSRTVDVPNNSSADYATNFYVVYEPVANKIVFFWEDDGNDGHYITGTPNGTVGDKDSTITWDNGNRVDDWNTDWYTYQAKPKLGASGAILLPYRDGSKAYLSIKQFPATDVTTGNFVGFSSAAYTDGQTAKINVVGNTSTQSSLSAGSKYYVQNDGTLATTAASPSVEAGIALSSTKLLIRQ
jgi:hypothetical protein